MPHLFHDEIFFLQNIYTITLKVNNRVGMHYLIESIYTIGGVEMRHLDVHVAFVS